MQQGSWRAKLKWGVVLVSLGFVAVFYRNYNPATTNYFPSCPFKALTGYECAGCGSQRAIHYLLHLDWHSAFHANALFVLALPYLLVGAVFDLIPNLSNRALRIRKKLYGTQAILVVLIIIVAYWILRNVF